jgi:hypothetical protein
MENNAWKTAISDQIAVGLVNQLEHGRKVNNTLDKRIRASRQDTMWFIALGFMGWSAGDGRAAKHINQFSSALTGIPESQRWGAFLRLLAERIDRRQINLQGLRKHNSVVYSTLRTWQKIAAGQLLASLTGGDTKWFDTGLGASEGAIAKLITCAAENARS